MSLYEKLLETWGYAKAHSALHPEDWKMKVDSIGSTISLSDITDL